MNKQFAQYTITFHDFLLEEENFFNFVNLGTDARNELFIKAFKSVYDNLEIGGETQAEFIQFVTDTYYRYENFYKQRIETYENQVSLNDLIEFGKTTTFYELPNKQTNSQYATNITDEKYKNTNEKLRKREEILGAIKDIYLEFAYVFEDCFVGIYFSVSIH